MRFPIIVVVIATALGGSVASARDTKLMLSVQEGLSTPAAKEKLGSGVRFFFGKQPHPAVAKEFGEYVTNPKTNAANKTDKAACEWVFLSAVLALRDRATSLGGNAVVNIKSYYKKNEVVSETEYECHAGAFIAGVALKGTVVKLSE
jgi:hypothetical protein